MKRPIQIYDQLRSKLTSYIETDFWALDEDFRKARRRLLEDEDLKAISQEPWFELIRKYKSSGKSVKDLTREDLKDKDGNAFLDEDELEFFKELAGAGLVGDFPLYAHQLEMLKQYAQGKNCIITSGTGSGKTESFLLPLFASLSKFYLKKDPVDIGEINRDALWYVRDQNKKGKDIQVELHRTNDSQHACVKAAIFYPMNALVSDQISRLRKALSFDGPEKVFQKAGKGRIYFGQYNSRISPIKYQQNGRLYADTKSKMRREMLSHLDSFDALHDAANHYADGEFDDLLATVPCPFRSELLNRYDAQHTPPDILITNPTMLNVMMMRKEEDSIFTKTKEWLEDKSNVFHLIVDELHLNRGTSGAEVSWLLQLYLHRIGLYPGHDQLRILASSASLKDANDYVEKFFGFTRGTFSDAFAVIEDSFDHISEHPEQETLTRDKLRKLVGFLPERSRENGREELAINEVFGVPLVDFLNRDQVRTEIAAKLEKPYQDEKRGTIPLTRIHQSLFGGEPDARELTEALFYVRSLYDGGKYGRDLPRLRMHVIFNNLPGLFTEANSLTKLSKDPHKLSQNGNRVVQLLFCYECGTLLFGGYRYKISETEFEILPISSGLDEAPNRFAHSIPDHMEYSEFAVFWPDKLNNTSLNKEYSKENRIYELYAKPEPNLRKNEFVQSKFGKTFTKGTWKRSYLDPASGRVSISFQPQNHESLVQGYTFVVDPEDEMKVKSLPSKCPCCAQQHSHLSKRTSPIHAFSTPHNKTAQLLSTQLLKEISISPDERKLIAFSDSRIGAAKLAANLEQENYWDSMRRLISKLRFESNRADEMSSRIRTLALEGGSWGNLDAELQDFMISTAPKGAFIDTLKACPDDNGLFQQLLPKILNPNDAQNNESIVADIEQRILPSKNRLNILLENFIRKGIPPMGNTFDVKDIYGENIYIKVREPIINGQRYSWPDIFLNPDDVTFDPHRAHIYHELTKEFARGLFGRSRFTIEMMAKGYVAFKEDVFTQDLFVELGMQDEASKKKFRESANTAIRIIGYKRHTISYPDFLKKEGNGQLKPIDAVIGADPEKSPLVRYLREVYPQNFQQIRNKILEIIANGGDKFYLDPKRYNLVLLKDRAGVYICQNCQTPHAHPSAGVCAHCMNALDQEPSINAGEYWSTNFYTQDSDEDIIRLHCEELTGQTDDFESRQRKFKNLFHEAEKEKKVFEQIDIISATTTMEVGIDIGSLSATLMGNMAPERYNYQQRVGRAGRGGQAFSLAVTICRNSSHDAFYYENLDRMLNATSPTPFYPENDQPIRERFMFKELLRLAFANVGAELLSYDQPKGDVHGRMGPMSNWQNDEIKSSIKGKIDEAFQSQDFKEWLDKISIEGITLEKAKAILEKKLESPIKAAGLAETLAENGILPMYGMPTNIRIAFQYSKDKKTDRQAEIALSEFAPGAELLKDKKYFPMKGITTPPGEHGSGPVVNADGSNLFYYTERQGGIDIYTEAPQDVIGVKAAIIPNAYYTAKEKYETDPNKRRHQIGIPKFNNQNDASISQKKIANTISKIYTGDLYSINANYDGEGFQFWEDNYNDWKRWSTIKPRQPRENDEQEQAEPMGTFVLANKWYTSVLEIQPKELVDGLRHGTYGEENDPVKKSLNTAIRGAAYSAAFILRSVFTTDLDVDGEELRVLQLRELNDSKKLALLYADQLINGSGFCERLNEDLSKIFKMLFGDQENDFAKILMSEANLHCDSASYSNILNYRNSRFHSILDWRLGLTYLRMIYGINAPEILSADKTLREFQKPDDATWLDGFNANFKVWAENLNMGTYHLHDGLPIALTHDQSTAYIGIHPLWDIENPKGILEKVIKDHEESNRTVKFVDSFNLLRRPGHCKTILMEQHEEDGI